MPVFMMNNGDAVVVSFSTAVSRATSVPSQYRLYQVEYSGVSKNETNNKNVADRSIQPNALESISPFLAQSRIVCLNNVQTEARLTMKFFRRQKKSNYKPLVNKTSAQVKVVPPPPNRRPNIEERISMLEMAQLHHLGVYVPENGIRLVLPRDTQPHKNQYSFHDAPRRPKTEIV